MARTKSGGGAAVEEREQAHATATDWVAVARELGPVVASRAATHDADGSFVADSYDDMRAAGLFSALIPSELGGGGASHAMTAAVIRELARHDASTALAYAMHCHPIATNVFKHRRGDQKATATLRKIAAGDLVIAGTGANDWLGSTGSAEPVEGGFRVNAHKRFVSGSTGAHVFVTSARVEGPDGPEVIHFSAPFSDPAIQVLDDWDAHGMRGTGSNNVVIEDLFVPADSVIVRRPADVWHPMWEVVLPVALPLIVAAYVGLADAASARATEVARAAGGEYIAEVGTMLTQLELARMALADMLRLTNGYDFEPSLDGADATLIRKAIATDAVTTVLDYAADLLGGRSFLRGEPIERMLRDARAMQFHPLPARQQRRFTGRVGLGIGID